MISAILLAAGESRRMGKENKLFLDYQGQYMIRHIAEQIVLSEVEETIVVTGYQDEAIRKSLSAFDLRFVHNPDYFSGQTSSIKAGVIKLSLVSKGFLICLGDMPLLRSMHYNAVSNKLKKEMNELDRAIVRPVYKEERGHPVAFSSTFKEEILSCDDPKGCSSVLKNNEACLFNWPIANKAFYQDIDTKMDYYKI